VETGQLKASFKGHTDAISSVAFSPDDKTLLSGSADGTARLWDVVTGQELLTLKGHKSTVSLVAFAPDGKRLATASGPEVKLWFAATEAEATAFRTEVDRDDPDSPPAQTDAANRLWEIGRHAEAEQGYRKALARLEKLAAASPTVAAYRDDMVHAWFNLSLLLASTGRPQDAEHAAQQAFEQWQNLPADFLRRLPSDWQVLASRRRAAGAAREAEDISSQTLILYEKLSEASPKDPRYRDMLAWVHKDRGVHYAARNQSDKALADYIAASELEPTNPVLWHNRAISHARLSQLDEAIHAYGKVIELKPLDPQAWFQRGEVHYRLKHHAEAFADFSKCLELKAEHVGALHLRGHCHEAMGRWAESVADHTRAIELAPQDPQLRICRGSAHAQLEEWQKAAEDFEHATTLWPPNPGAGYNLALLELRRGDRAGYGKVCSNMLERERLANADAAYWTAWTCVLAPDAVADWAKPLRIAEEACADHGKSYDLSTNLGAVLYRAGRFKEAAQRLAEAEAAFPQSPTPRGSIVYNWLFQAMAQRQLGNTAEAASWFKKAVQEIDEPKTAQDPATIRWNRRLSLQLLRHEAEELLAKKSQ